MNDLVARLDISQPGVSKHLKVLRKSGLVACGSSPTASTGPAASRHSNDTWRRTRNDRSLENIDHRPTLRFERRYDHGVERVWRAITDPDELRHWFPPGEELEVTESEPPRLLAGSWYGDELRFELRPDGDGCVLVFTHAFDDRSKAARDAAGWDRCFVRLEALLGGEPMSDKESLEGWSEVHERYAAEFGVDPALGRQALAEHESQR